MKILPYFDKWLIDKNEPREKRSHHMGSLDNCARQQYYSWVNAPRNPRTAGDLLKMEQGKVIELIFEQFLDDMVENGTFKKYDKQVEVKGNIEGLKKPVHGYIDYIIYTENNMYAIELKSMFGRGIVNIQSSGNPKEDYLKQLFTYMKFFDLPFMIHPYIGRDFGYRTEFFVEYFKDDQGEGLTWVNELKNEKVIWRYDFQEVTKKLKDIELMVELKTLPEREYMAVIDDSEVIKEATDKGVKINGWQCLYCDFRNHCWEGVLKKSKGQLYHGEKWLRASRRRK